VVVSSVVVVVVRMMLSRRGVAAKLERLEVGTVAAGVVLVEVGLESDGLAGVAGGGLGHDDESDTIDRGLDSGTLECRWAS